MSSLILLGDGLGYCTNFAILLYFGKKIICPTEGKKAIRETINNLEEKVNRLFHQVRALDKNDKKDGEEIKFSRKRKRSAETISCGKRPKIFQTVDENKQENDEDGIKGSCSQTTDDYNFPGERELQNNPIINIKHVETFAMNSKIINVNKYADIHPQATETCDE